MVGSLGALVAETPREGSLVARGPKGDAAPPLAYSFPQLYKEAYAAETDHFLDILKGMTLELKIETESRLHSLLELNLLFGPVESPG